MYKPLLFLNDKEIKEITVFDDLPSIQDGDNSGRTPTLSMDRDILGRILNINVTLGITPRSEAIALLNILKNPNITVKFLDSESDTYKIMDCYCVDPKKELLPGMMNYYSSLSFVLISNERYD